MTDPSEVKISDDELDWIDSEWPREPGRFDVKRKILALFLARRVPDVEVEPSTYAWDFDEINMAAAHNTCRAHILMGDTQ